MRGMGPADWAAFGAKMATDDALFEAYLRCECAQSTVNDNLQQLLVDK